MLISIDFWTSRDTDHLPSQLSLFNMPQSPRDICLKLIIRHGKHSGRRGAVLYMHTCPPCHVEITSRSMSRSAPYILPVPPFLHHLRLSRCRIFLVFLSLFCGVMCVLLLIDTLRPRVSSISGPAYTRLIRGGPLLMVPDETHRARPYHVACISITAKQYFLPQSAVCVGRCVGRRYTFLSRFRTVPLFYVFVPPSSSCTTTRTPHTHTPLS